MMLHVIRILLPLYTVCCLFFSIKPHTRHCGRLIDVTVNNDGYALLGLFEDSSMDETNLFGPVKSYAGSS
jgi:hypothetical protein